jgi:hypothetical protein
MSITHGQTKWLGKFDSEGFALFGCPLCDHVAGIHPYAKKVYKLVARGPKGIRHFTSTNAACIEAAYALEIWKPDDLGLITLAALKSYGGLRSGFGHPKKKRKADAEVSTAVH